MGDEFDIDAEPELIADYECETGEGPMWHPDEERLYWIDIPTGRMFRYDPAAGEHEQCYDGDVIGGFTIQEDGSLLLFKDRGAVEIWRDREFETVIEEIPDERDSRFNDVIADPEGRVFCGTMPTEDELGTLYRLDTDGTLTTVEESVDISNGMGFTPNREELYYTETGRGTIYKYDYDLDTGELSNRRVFVDVPDGEGGPDGMTVDSDGYVWSARWNGSALYRYAPDGTEVGSVEFPAKKVSSVTFGGDDYTDAYVTTAGGPNKETEGEGAGALFRVDLGVQGIEEFRSNVEP